MKKIIIGIIVIVLIIWGVSAILGEERQISNKQIKIGALFPLSGLASVYGEGSREGVEVALLDIKEKYPNLDIEIIYEDSFYNPKKAVDGYRKLKSIDNVSAILTGGSQISLAVKDLSDQDGVLQMAVWSSAPSYSFGEHNLSFRVTSLAEDHAPPMLKYMGGNGYEKVAILYAKNEFGVAVKEALEKEAGDFNVNILFAEGFDSDDLDFRTQLLKIKNAEVDGIYFVGLAGQLVNILKEAHELGIDKQFFSQWSVEDQQLLDGAGELAEGLIYTYPFDHESSLSEGLTSKYNKLYGRIPSGYVAESYLGLMLIAEAIDSCNGNTDVVCWKNYLDEIEDHPTIMGLSTINSNGDIKVGEIFLKTLKNGQFVKYEE